MLSFLIKRNEYFIAQSSLIFRVLERKRGSLKHFEYCLPKETSNEEELQEEDLFHLFEMVEQYQFKKGEVSFFVNDESLLFRTIELPNKSAYENLSEYVEMEIDHTIHLPFKNVAYDLYYANEQKTKAIMFAAEEEEIMEKAENYEAIGWEPVVAGVEALSTYRYLEYTNQLPDVPIFLIVHWGIEGLSLSVFNTDLMEFHRYQPFEGAESRWKVEHHQNDCQIQLLEVLQEEIIIADAVDELVRVLQFYRYSLHKGERAVQYAIVLGDHPNESDIISSISEKVDFPVRGIDERKHAEYYPSIPKYFAPLIGLSLREKGDT